MIAIASVVNLSIPSEASSSFASEVERLRDRCGPESCRRRWRSRNRRLAKKTQGRDMTRRFTLPERFGSRAFEEMLGAAVCHF